MFAFVCLLLVLSIPTVISAYARRGGLGAHVRRRIPGKWYYFSVGVVDYVQARRNHELLESRFPYYSLLDEDEKREFLFRVHQIHRSKHFFSEDGNIIPAQEILLSATIAQLTFGRSDRYWLPGFHYIRIHPDAFYSRMIGAHVKGLTMGRTLVHISWRHFFEGLTDERDGISLGIHEFAHAMKLDHRHVFERDELAAWTRAAEDVLSRGSNGGVVREYGFSNLSELWAVCCEIFFERPVEFRREEPELYAAMTGVLNQDMANRVVHNSRPPDSTARA